MYAICCCVIALENVCRATLYMLRLSDGSVYDDLFDHGRNKSMRVIDLADPNAPHCQAVAGFKPSIESSGKSGSPPRPLANRSERRFVTGFALNESMINEIEDNLRICRTMLGIEQL